MKYWASSRETTDLPTPPFSPPIRWMFVMRTRLQHSLALRHSSSPAASRLGRRSAVLPLARHQREVRALRVVALENPLPARYFMGAHQDRAARSLDAICSRIDGRNIEVVAPERTRNGRRLRHHAARRWAACCKQLISAHLAHVEAVRLRPPEHGFIERERALPFVGIQLAP